MRKKNIRDLYADTAVIAANHSGQILHDALSLTPELSKLGEAVESIAKLAAEYAPPQPSRIRISDPSLDVSDPNTHLSILQGHLRTISANLKRAAVELADRQKLLDTVLSEARN